MATAELKHPQTSAKKLDTKQAARLALKYFNDLFPDAQISDVALEEVEFSDDENHWLITLGYETQTAQAKQLNKQLVHLFGPSPARKYKVFKVDAQTGKVISMRIRKLD